MRATPFKFLCALGCAFFAYAINASSQSTELIISEYIEGSSNNKAIEIYNPTGAAVNLATEGYTVQMFFNGNPVAGLTINLTGTVAAGDVYVIAQATADAVILAQADQANGSGWFNGDDAVVLRRGTTVIDSLGQVGFDPGTEWGSGLTSTADNTLRRRGTVLTGDTNVTDVFDPAVEWEAFAANTFDNLGVYSVTPPPPPPTLLEIYQIQGNVNASPYVGQRVQTLDNIVTGRATNGFFVQMPAERADSDDSTSNGIFVFTGSTPTVQVGDQVDVTGMVQEFFDLTEISSPESVTIDSSGHALPAAVMFGATLPSHTPPTNLEPLEGMRVRVENALVTGPTDGFGDTAVVAGATRPFREPGIEFPGVPGYATTWDGNPEIFEINANGAGLPDASFVAGSIIDVAEGPLTFSFGDYQIWPTTLTPGGQPSILRPVRDRVAGELTVANQNMLRFFNTPVAAFEARLAKASLYIRTVLGSPDVLVLQEVQDITAANALATRITADDPASSYTAHLIEGHDPGGIDTAILVRSTVVVTSVAQHGFDETFTFNGSTDHLHDRPPLVMQGDYIGNGAPFPLTVIGVHNRSLSGIDGSDGPRIRAKRLAQARSLALYVQGIQTAEPNRRVVVIGDFNAFQFSDGYVDAVGIITGNLDPAGAIEPGHEDVVDPDLTNQVHTAAEFERYSFVFDGSAQTLDHTLTTANLQAYIRGFQFSRGNADAPESLRNDPSTPLALSDHDGQALFVMTDHDADGLPDDVDNCSTTGNTRQDDFDHDGTGDACDPDDDNDGVLDDADACPASKPLGMFVSVLTCNTTVPDQILENGCSITDSYTKIAAASRNQVEFVLRSLLFTTKLRLDRTINNRDWLALVKCSATTKPR